MGDVSSLDLYRLLLGSRMAEERITELSDSGELAGHHSGLNHEAIGVGVGCGVEPDDCVQTSYRSGAAVMHARGGLDVRGLVLQGFGLLPGPREQHLGGPKTLRSTGIVGGQVPMAVGVALAYRLRGLARLVVSVIGDGAANEGAVHEAMNIAGVRRLPVLFVIENNGIALSTLGRDSTAAKSLADRGVGYGMPAISVDGHDVVAVLASVQSAGSRIRSGAGPEIIEMAVTRPGRHASVLRDVRTEEDLERARSVDCVQLLRNRLVMSGDLTEPDDYRLRETLELTIAAAVDEARSRRAVRNLPTDEPQFTDREAWQLAYASPSPAWMET